MHKKAKKRRLTAEIGNFLSIKEKQNDYKLSAVDREEKIPYFLSFFYLGNSIIEIVKKVNCYRITEYRELKKQKLGQYFPQNDHAYPINRLKKSLKYRVPAKYFGFVGFFVLIRFEPRATL